MKADDIRLSELVDFADGQFNLYGRRLVLHSIDAFAQLRKDLVHIVGPDHARHLLTRFGYFWGNADAAAMKRVFTWDSLTELIKAGPRMHTLQGVVRTAVKSLYLDESTGRFEMNVIWRDSGEVEEHHAALGKSNAPSCWMLVGYASGYASFCMGKDIYFVETKCRSQGDPICAAVGKDAESWGDELKPHLQYFQADDIQDTVLNLTRELRRKTRQLERYRRRIARLQKTSAPTLIEARSKSFRRALEIAARAAPFDSSILITGETGVGKEIVARYVHDLSRRAKGPFLAVNCGALPETLLESELFGHKAGAFTGAVADRKGLFEQAANGTLLLDEIGDISPAMQVKLLRVLQEREIIRLGESLPRRINARVIAATNRDLEKALAEGRFREDLLYRLRVIEIEVPPLRERAEDVLPLARHFVRLFARKLKMPHLRLDARCLDCLQSYHWPGNVRELENAIERAAVLSENGVILPELLPRKIIQTVFSAEPNTKSAMQTLADIEHDHIRAVLKFTGGNRARAARILGVSPSTLWRKLRNQNPAHP